MAAEPKNPRPRAIVESDLPVSCPRRALAIHSRASCQGTGAKSRRGSLGTLAKTSVGRGPRFRPSVRCSHAPAFALDRACPHTRHRCLCQARLYVSATSEPVPSPEYRGPRAQTRRPVMGPSPSPTATAIATACSTGRRVADAATGRQWTIRAAARGLVRSLRPSRFTCSYIYSPCSRMVGSSGSWLAPRLRVAKNRNTNQKNPPRPSHKHANAMIANRFPLDTNACLPRV